MREWENARVGEWERALKQRIPSPPPLPSSSPPSSLSSSLLPPPSSDDGEVTRLSSELTSLKLTVAELEKERDFYFAKLRDVEIACQTNEKEVVSELVDDIQKILYATSEDTPDAPQEPLPAETAALPTEAAAVTA